jgi:hypothetical protein
MVKNELLFTGFGEMPIRRYLHDDTCISMLEMPDITLKFQDGMLSFPSTNLYNDLSLNFFEDCVNPTPASASGHRKLQTIFNLIDPNSKLCQPIFDLVKVVSIYEHEAVYRNGYTYPKTDELQLYLLKGGVLNYPPISKGFEMIPRNYCNYIVVDRMSCTIFISVEFAEVFNRLDFSKVDLYFPTL